MKTGFRVKPLSRNGIDQKAQNIHKEFGIQGSRPITFYLS